MQLEGLRWRRRVEDEGRGAAGEVVDSGQLGKEGAAAAVGERAAIAVARPGAGESAVATGAAVDGLTGKGEDL